MIAKLAYISFPGPGRYVLNFQPFGSDELQQFEISKDQMRNILISGIEVMLREKTDRTGN